MELPENPMVKANILSNLLFCYTLPIFIKGKKKNLEPSDLYRALDEDKSSTLGDRMEIAWHKEVEKQASRGKDPSLLRATLKVFGWNIIKLGLIQLCIEFGLKVTQPLFVGGLVTYYMQPDGNISEAYWYAGGVILCSALNVLTQHAFMLGQFHCGMKIRISLISIIYRKALRLSQTALGNTTAGQIVNLLSNDVGKFDSALIGMHQLWVGPLEIALVVFIIYQHIGIAAFAGVGFLIAFIPFQAYIGKKISTFRAKTAIRSDERIRLMNEIIQGIQVIKMYAWEKPFGKLVTSARKREVNTIRYASYIRAIMLSFTVFVTRFSVFISLTMYVLLGMILTAEKAFVVTAYYNILRQSMTVHFPRAISQLAETLVSFKRIQRFLTYEEAKVKHPVDAQLTSNGEIPVQLSVTNKDIMNNKELLNNCEKEPAEPFLELLRVKAKWNPGLTDYTLDDVSFTAKPGELVAVIGPVGAGKSSLIQAILGELPTESGSIEMSGQISYASQDPWLFGGTVQQNILFGQLMDRKRYREVIRQCALERDFDLLPFGDKTIVGDRGQSLSGGQKARVNLARAVYRKASIYLFDDPLSAVDTHVGKHLFEQCMRNYLKDHIVILATHQLQYLKQADKIIIIDHGKILAIGKYTDLKEQESDFSDLLLDNQEEEEQLEVSFEIYDKPGEIQSRRNSETSVETVKSEKCADTQMQVKEIQKRGAIGFDLYVKYFRSGGGVFLLLIATSFCICAQILGSGCDFFLSYWVNKQTALAVNVTVTDTPISINTTDAEMTTNASYLTNDTVTVEPYENRDMMDIYIFSSLIIATIIVTLSRSFLVFNVAMRASRKLHDAMYRGVSRATMYFFNTNPVGRILNRFSKDMGHVDELLPTVILEVIQIFLTLGGIVVVIIIVNTWFIIPSLLMVVLFYYLRSFYLKTSRDVKRMEGVTRSPIFSHLSASLMGLSTIRAFEAEAILCQEFDHHQDLHSSVFFTFVSTNRAFGFWLDCICVIYIAIVTLSFFVLGEEQAGNVGLAITQALNMTGMVQWGMRQSAELENTMTSVERVVEYDTLEKEGELESADVHKPPKHWPQKGQIKFQKLSLRYFPDAKSDVVLKNLEFEIMPKEKIGIVGRTGAGKSSIINALFRLAYNEGSIVIDGKDIKHLGLHDLRSKISIIPQEPVLFSGTIRYNLDPFDEYSDPKIWLALEQVKLKSAISDLPLGLQTKVSAGGSNFSVGQRQLVCLARAILRENNILVLDEATANVDPQTDNLIQTTIREEFADCTVITIAHRLNTIMDSDKVLVMDAGHIVEYGPPYLLLTEPEYESNIFYSMAQETGEATFKALMQVAKDAYESRTNICSPE